MQVDSALDLWCGQDHLGGVHFEVLIYKLTLSLFIDYMASAIARAGLRFITNNTETKMGCKLNSRTTDIFDMTFLI